MAGGRAYWDKALTKIFLDLCIAEKIKHNYNKKGLTNIGWQNLYGNFREQIGRNYDNKQLQNKFSTLKRQYKLWRSLKNKSRGGWDNNSGTIRCDDDCWENRIEENRDFGQFRGKPLEHEDELTTLFGCMDTEEGTILCVGGTGERTPSGGSDDNLTPMSNDNVGRSSAGRVAQRQGRSRCLIAHHPRRIRVWSAM